MGEEVTTLETLTKVRELLSDPDRWCQGLRARNKDGLPVEPDGRTAVSWCLSGAIQRVSATSYLGFDAISAIDEIFDARSVLDEIIYVSLEEYNDTHTHTEVLALLDEAIEKEKVAS